MIETVFFDGDQTLWDFDAVMRGAMTATLDEPRSFGPDPPPPPSASTTSWPTGRQSPRRTARER